MQATVEYMYTKENTTVPVYKNIFSVNRIVEKAQLIRSLRDEKENKRDGKNVTFKLDLALDIRQYYCLIGLCI